MSLKSFPSLESLSAAAAEEFALLAKDAIIERGKCNMALSGGNTPRSLYEAIAKDYRSAIDWNRVHIYWGDERYVSHNDPASNYRMAKETLLDHIQIPAENVYPIDTSFSNPDDSARDYASKIQDILPFELILLGLGNDGHTASLFPGTNFESITGKLVVVTSSPIPPVVRISLTMDVINAARNVFFLVAGSDKAVILHEVLEDSKNDHPHFPAAMVKPAGNLVWFVDDTANS
jgi:6-phosphogluconolactonase